MKLKKSFQDGDKPQFNPLLANQDTKNMGAQASQYVPDDNNRLDALLHEYDNVFGSVLSQTDLQYKAQLCGLAYEFTVSYFRSLNLELKTQDNIFKLPGSVFLQASQVLLNKLIDDRALSPNAILSCFWCVAQLLKNVFDQVIINHYLGLHDNKLAKAELVDLAVAKLNSAMTTFGQLTILYSHYWAPNEQDTAQRLQLFLIQSHSAAVFEVIQNAFLNQELALYDDKITRALITKKIRGEE